MQITKIENLECLVNLEVLDISFNRLRVIEGLEKLTKLKRLFLVSNKITKIDNLGHLKDLELLELGDNRLESNNGMLRHSLDAFEGELEFVVFFIEPSFAFGAPLSLFLRSLLSLFFCL